MGRLVVPNVDDDLKRRFKVYCINKGTTMKDEVIAFMERTLKNAEKAESK